MNLDHRSSVLACLVQGVYTLERDRQLERHESQALAPPWWEKFQFKLLRRLQDDGDADISIFGAIYEFKPLSEPHSHLSKDGIPRYVIAFRGTMFKRDSLFGDLGSNIRLIRNDLHKTSRFEIAMEAVRAIVDDKGSSNVWLAGHSLGSAMAMLAGRTMAKTGKFLETFLFNPPFVSLPIERIRNEREKHVIRAICSLITAGLAVATKRNHNNTGSSEDPFLALSTWFPYLFVNSADFICSEYIGYFEHRKKMEEKGAGAIENLATRNSFGGLLVNAILKKDVMNTSEPQHLIPSANLIVNSTSSRGLRGFKARLKAGLKGLKDAHEIQQWWKPELNLQPRVCKCEPKPGPATTEAFGFGPWVAK